jgi:hypothetical protein
MFRPVCRSSSYKIVDRPSDTDLLTPFTNGCAWFEPCYRASSPGSAHLLLQGARLLERNQPNRSARVESLHILAPEHRSEIARKTVKAVGLGRKNVD